MSGANSLSVDGALVMQTTMETLIYGFSVCIFGATIHTLAHVPMKGQRNMMLVASAMFILSTIHTGCMIGKTLEAFTVHGEGQARDDWINDIGKPVEVLKDTTMALQTMIGDGVLVWRLYMVWPKIYVIALPLALLLAGTGTCFAFVIRNGLSSAPVLTFDPPTEKFILSYFSCTMAANFIATFLLAWRIWRFRDEMAESTTQASRFARSLRHIVRVVLDSGLIYTACTLTLIVTLATGTRGHIVTLGMTIPTISIVFNLIILRLALARQFRDTGRTHIFSRSAYSYSAGKETTEAGPRTPRTPMHPVKMEFKKPDDVSTMQYAEDASKESVKDNASSSKDLAAEKV